MCDKHSISMDKFSAVLSRPQIWFGDVELPNTLARLKIGSPCKYQIDRGIPGSNSAKCTLRVHLFSVLWFGTRVACEMVSDGGGRFIPAGIAGLHALSLLLVSLVAHDRATEDNHTHHSGRFSFTNMKERTTLVGTVHRPRQGGINPVPL